MKYLSSILILFIFLSVVSGIYNGTAQSQETLKHAYKDLFLMGTALSANQINGDDPRALTLTAQQFNSITAENDMKFGPIHPEPGTYRFETPDRFIEFGEQNDMFIVGHTLIWHAQTSNWIFKDDDGNDVDRETLLARMRDHISTVVGRYKGRVHGWDVVNEALNEDGSLRQSKWMKIIGEDYVQKAFEYTHQIDPEAELYYNDYNLFHKEKRDGAVRLVKNLLANGVRVDAIGMQGHWGLDYPAVEEAEASILAFAELGVQTMVTELDINVLPDPQTWRGADVSLSAEARDALDPYKDGLPDSVQQHLAGKYAELFGLFVKHSDKISRVTFWGTHDGHSWKNNWPVRGRTNYPLLFDRNYTPKPAFEAVIKVAKPS
jgi:endo-1,4-beta-xylanase